MTVEGFPFWKLDFTADGSRKGHLRLARELAVSGITDLFIFAHGWNNDEATAMQLYRGFFGEAAKLAIRPGAAIGVAGVCWPSILFPGDHLFNGAFAGGTASLTPPAPLPSLTSELAKVFTGSGQRRDLVGLLDLLRRRPRLDAALLDFRDKLASILRAEDEHPGSSADNLEFRLATAGDEEWRRLLHALSAGGGTSPDGGAAGLGDIFGALWHGALNVLRLATFWQMKNRAGIVGRNGLGPLIGFVFAAAPRLRVHLIGHSFGARLVSYALAGLPHAATAAVSPVKSLLLMQGAFSHFAFADTLPFDPIRGGDLRGMSARVDGPLMATFSGKDLAVGLAYPAASILGGQDAANTGDLACRWAGMGHDGAQGVGAPTVALGVPGTVYPFHKGAWLNLDGNQVITRGGPPIGAHGDITHPETAWLALSAAGVASVDTRN